VPRPGGAYGPDVTFLGVPRADLDERWTYSEADVVIVGAPFDGGTSHRAGARFGPQAIRVADHLPHDGSRPHLALRVDPLTELRVVDAGDVEMPPGETELSLRQLEDAILKVAAVGAVPVVLGGDHTIVLADVTGVARHVGWGRVSVVHLGARPGTGDTQLGLLYGHTTPMRRLVESGATRPDRVVQIGLRGYWPDPRTLNWMAAQGMRSYEMTEIVRRGLDDVLAEACATAAEDCDGVFLSVDIGVADPGSAPGTGTPEPGGLSGRELLGAVRRICLDLPVVGVDVAEVSPPYDIADVTARLANRVVLESLSGICRRGRQEAGELPPLNPGDNLLSGRITGGR
jgi:agmatinase